MGRVERLRLDGLPEVEGRHSDILVGQERVQIRREGQERVLQGGVGRGVGGGGQQCGLGQSEERLCAAEFLHLRGVEVDAGAAGRGGFGNLEQAILALEDATEQIVDCREAFDDDFLAAVLGEVEIELVDDLLGLLGQVEAAVDLLDLLLGEGQGAERVEIAFEGGEIQDDGLIHVFSHDILPSVLPLRGGFQFRESASIALPRFSIRFSISHYDLQNNA